MHLPIFSLLYSTCTPVLIGAHKSLLIREVSFGEREHHMHAQYWLPGVCILYGRLFSKVVSACNSGT